MEDIAILYICTGNYAKLFQQFYQSARKNFIPSMTKHFYVWTDQDLGEIDMDEVSIIPKQFKPWPAATIQRYKDFNTIKQIILEHKYVFFCNADLNITEEIGEEILPDDEHPLVGVRHIQFVKEQYKFHELWQSTEHNVFSNAYIDDEEIPYIYVFACLIGGRSKEFIEMSEVIEKWTDEDSAKGIIPVWDDESYYNVYRLRHPELFKLLPPEYAYPDMSGIKGYEPKIYKIYKPAFFACTDFRIYVDSLKSRNESRLASFFSPVISG